ncbi:hypothetical protein Taro_031246 [Colocasia esculenta]|uniref:Uncharacterized protein n=1 Tax=Colocasia esculenta TaxID=4460 RepID=A0A843W2M6_COLES|nr:hypothetical protein [Colocasia esculenta]
MPQALILSFLFLEIWKFEMTDRRDWGGGGDDPEDNTQCMIERIWESLTDIRRRMDQQAPVPPVAVPPGDGETPSESRIQRNKRRINSISVERVMALFVGPMRTAPSDATCCMDAT